MTTVSITILMTACRDSNQTTAESTPVSSSTAAASPTITPTTSPTTMSYRTDKWLGRWTGVEGTYLLISRSGDSYSIEISDLDGPKLYQGVPAGDRIQFERAGKTESIRATDGKGTGMKWMAREHNCLVITVGSEGFCRK
jgi:hypothetical protein